MSRTKTCNPIVEKPGLPTPESELRIDPFMPLILEAAEADRALATYPGIRRALWIYRNSSNGYSNELTEWAGLAHQAQVTRGKARIELPDTHMFQLAVPEATLILGKPFSRYGCQYTQETHLPIENPGPQFGRILSYDLHAPGPGRLALLRLHIPGLQKPDGSFIRLGVEPGALLTEQISIVPHPGQATIAQASGQLTLTATFGQ